MDTTSTRCLIIGSGPAGYTAAIYAARSGLNPILFEGMEPGGQLTTTTVVENFPGYPEGVTGTAMMEDFKKQAQNFDVDIRSGIVTHVDFSARPFKVTIDGRHVIESDSVIISTGATAKYLGLASEMRFRGQGVSACATCDGFFYRGQDVIVVGGGDTACGEALYLASICRKVYMVVRKEKMRASQTLQDRVNKADNIEVLYGYNTVEVLGDQNGVTGALVRHTSGKEKVLDAYGFFLGIGHHPNTEIFKGRLELDADGYIVTKPGTSLTSVEGVFAAGDVRDPVYRQAVIAAGSGCIAALDAEAFLLEH